jgi:citrate lyase subunit beta/citryl-CoA lyase
MRFPNCRSVLFAPANQRKLLDKLLQSGADVVVADLEDAVPADTRSKSIARSVLAQWLPAVGERHARPHVFVRVNGPKTPWHGRRSAND